MSSRLIREQRKKKRGLAKTLATLGALGLVTGAYAMSRRGSAGSSTSTPTITTPSVTPTVTPKVFNPFDGGTNRPPLPSYSSDEAGSGYTSPRKFKTGGQGISQQALQQRYPRIHQTSTSVGIPRVEPTQSAYDFISGYRKGQPRNPSRNNSTEVQTPVTGSTTTPTTTGGNQFINQGLNALKGIFGG